MASTLTARNEDLSSARFRNFFESGRPTDAYQLQSPPSSNSESGTPAGKSPVSPVTTNSNSGPATHVYQHGRHQQLYMPNGPLYIPAALRPTEFPVKHSPPKYGIKPMGKVHSGPPTPPHSADGKAESEETPQKLLGEGIAKQSMTRIVTDEWRELEDVKGVPTRDHWKPDPLSTVCDFASCPIMFNFFNRRHHCRRCGLIFCAEHTSHEVPLDKHARLHPDGYKEKACECCWHDYKVWEMYRKNNRKGSTKSNTPVGSGAATPTTAKDITPTQTQSQSQPQAKPTGQGDGKGRGSGEISFGSLFRDSNWSTF